MRYKVPQNIDVEDRVVGPLTVRQFIVILAGVGFLTALYFVMTPIRFLFYPLALVLGAGFVGVAFYEYGSQHPETILYHAFQSITKPKFRVWKKETPQEGGQNNVQQKNIEEIPKVVKKEDLSKARERIAQAAARVDRQAHEIEGAQDAFENGLTSRDLNKMAKDAKIKKFKEPLLSQIASISPQKIFHYEKIEKIDSKSILPESSS